MSFQSRKLRVQIPCGERTIVEQDPANLLCAFPTRFCHETCGFVTPTGCGFPTPCHWHTCGVVTPVCPLGGHPTQIVCHYVTRYCDGRTYPIACLGFSRPPDIDPGTIVIDPEDLPALREQLEAHLQEVEKAEQALKEREEKK